MGSKKSNPSFDELYRSIQAYFLHHMTEFKHEIVDLINKNHNDLEMMCRGNRNHVSFPSRTNRFEDNSPCEDNRSPNPDNTGNIFALCHSINLNQNETQSMLQSGEETINTLLLENRNLRENVTELNERIRNLSEQLDAAKASNDENFIRYENSLKNYMKISLDSNLIIRALVSDVMYMKYDIMMRKKSERDNGEFRGVRQIRDVTGEQAAGGHFVRDQKDINEIVEIIADTLRVEGPSSNRCAAFCRPKSITIQFQEDELLDEWLKAAKQRRELNERNIYQQLIELEEDNVVVNIAPFDCRICLSAIERGGGIVLKECLHVFCRECLSQTVEFSEDAEINCPHRDDTGEVCTHKLLEREVREIVSRDLYEKYLTRSLTLSESKIKNSYHCNTPDCCGWWIIEDEATFVNCPVCMAENCVRCRAIHPNYNCRQYQEELEIMAENDPSARKTLRYFREMKERGQAMNCPTCNVTVMKTEGCDFCVCTMCKTDICWATMGPRWGPAGHGDISGGCRCGVNGIKCHQNCNYCH